MRTNGDNNKGIYDSIKVWHNILLHHKGSDASLKAACTILFELLMLRVKDFPTRSEFLSADDQKINDYNETNSEKLPNTIRLQCLRMCIMQDKTLYHAYTNFLNSQRSTRGQTWQPDYMEFYEILQSNAELLDSGKTASYKANFLSAYSDDYFDDDDSDDKSTYDDLYAYLARHRHPDLEAFLAQRGPRKRPQKKGTHPNRSVKFPDDLKQELTPEFLRAFNAMKVSTQLWICSLFGKKSEKNADLIVRLLDVHDTDIFSDDDSIYYSSNTVEHADSCDDSLWCLSSD